MIENARQAHAANKVWVNLRINGEKVLFGNGAVGLIESKGALTPLQGMVVYLATLGLAPRQIYDTLIEQGHVHNPIRNVVVRDKDGNVVFSGMGRVDPPGCLGDCSEETFEGPICGVCCCCKACASSYDYAPGGVANGSCPGCGL